MLKPLSYYQHLFPLYLQNDDSFMSNVATYYNLLQNSDNICTDIANIFDVFSYRFIEDMKAKDADNLASSRPYGSYSDKLDKIGKIVNIRREDIYNASTSIGRADNYAMLYAVRLAILLNFCGFQRKYLDKIFSSVMPAITLVPLTKVEDGEVSCEYNVVAAMSCIDISYYSRARYMFGYGVLNQLLQLLGITCSINMEAIFTPVAWWSEEYIPSDSDSYWNTGEWSY